MNAAVKFLVLLDAARPALLIDSGKHLLGEVIEDDGFIVDSLLLNAKVCAVSRTDMLDVVVPPLPGFGAALLPVALIATRRPNHGHPMPPGITVEMACRIHRVVRRRRRLRPTFAFAAVTRQDARASARSAPPGASRSGARAALR